MIIGYIGLMGSGKTLSMIRELLKNYAQGMKIYTNFDIAIPHEEIDFDKLYAMAEHQIPLSDVCIALDEVHILLDSRGGMSKKSRVMTFWLNQTRKLNVKLFYTTQYSHQVDKRLRSGTDLWVFCHGVHINKNGDDIFVCYNDIMGPQTTQHEVFKGNDFYDFYDTRQVIRFMVKK